MRFLMTLLFLSSGTFSFAHAENLQCVEFLNETSLNLKTSRSFNQHLSAIDDVESFKRFIQKFNNDIYSYSPADKRGFVRSGLYIIEKMSIAYISSLDVKSLDILLRLFSKVSHIQLGETFLSQIEVAVEKKISEFEARNISAMMFLLGKLRLKPSLRFVLTLENEFIKKIDQFNPQNLSNIIFGFANLGIEPSSHFVKAWQKRYLVVRDDFITINVANSLFSFYLLGSADMAVWFVNQTSQKQWNMIEKPLERRQVSLVYDYFETVQQVQLKPIIKFKGLFKTLVEKPRNKSEFEEQMEMRLALSGRDYEIEFQTTPGFYVDFYIPELKRVIQVDGPSHYIREWVNGVLVEHQRLHDIRMDEVLEVYGYHIRRQSYRDL